MHLSTRQRALGAFVLAGFAACAEPTAPADRFLVDIAGIVTPTAASIHDSLRVRFLYEASCGERELVLRFSPTQLEVRAFGYRPPPGTVCLGWIHYEQHVVAVPPRGTASPFTVRFVQPSGGDSIRVISVRAPSTGAP